jgi:predicted nucleotidyltransferase
MDKEIKQIVKDYKKRLELLGVKANKSLIFGSHLHGNAGIDSDIDLLIVSDDFSGMDLWDRLCLLGRARIGIKKPMEILGLTEDEYAREGEGSFIGDEVKLSGV